MRFRFYFLLFELLIFTLASETISEFDRVKERLLNLANQLSITEIADPPRAALYLNSRLVTNVPHQINLVNQLTEFVPEWSPRFLASDSTSPYYFSKFDNPSNLLSYLQAVESNETITNPFLNIFPQSYRSFLPLFSIFQCRQYFTPTSDLFFHNIELLIGPGQAELPFQQQSNQYSQFYCSLYGSTQFLLINSTEQSTFTSDFQTFFSQNTFADTSFYLTNLTPGTCLFIPSNWINGILLNNSISLVFTLKQLSKESDDDILLCSKTEQFTLDNITFSIQDSFDSENLTLLIYFYEFLNPPLFDQEYTSERFFYAFQNDKNISALIIKWTPELKDLIQDKLFHQLDINHDNIFNIGDYFDINPSNLQQLEKTIPDIFNQIRQAIYEQYQDFNGMLRYIKQQSSKQGLSDYDRENLITLIENLPEPIQKKLQTNNVNIKDVLTKLRNQKSNENKHHRTDF